MFKFDVFLIFFTENYQTKVLMSPYFSHVVSDAKTEKNREQVT